MSSIQDLIRLDATYHERNQLAIALALMALPDHDVKFSELAGYGFDPATGRGVVYVTLPSGAQVSWHMSDTITRDWQQNGCACLPLFSGKWDGTFVGRDEGWPAKHIQKHTKTNGSVLSRVYESFAASVSAGLDGKPYASGFGVGVASEPKEDIFRADPPNATHYRICSGGSVRFYRKVDGSWLYYHQDEQAWHPTDLGVDYLESHINPLETLRHYSTPNANEILNKIESAIADTSLADNLEPALWYDMLTGTTWLVDLFGKHTKYFISTDRKVYWLDGQHWELSAAAPEWVERTGSLVYNPGSIAVRK